MHFKDSYFAEMINSFGVNFHLLYQFIRKHASLLELDLALKDDTSDIALKAF